MSGALIKEAKFLSVSEKAPTEMLAWLYTCLFPTLSAEKDCYNIQHKYSKAEIIFV